MTTFSAEPLTPTAFLTRSARVFPDRLAVVDGERRLTYRELADGSRRLAGALRARGVRPGDRVAALCTNSLTMLQMHHGVPWAGAVLVSLNVRLSPFELRWIVDHSGASLIVADEALDEVAREVSEAAGLPLLIASGDPDEYQRELEAAEPLAVPCPDEHGLLALNYTSGTTGRPKGVMYGHRGAYLQALAMAHHAGLGPESRYLWTLPMFHCNGWSFPWAVTAAGGVHVCLPRVEPERIWHHLRHDGVTHLSAAPTVLTMIVGADAASDGPVGRRVEVQTGGAPPSPTLLGRLAALDLDVTHLYGLTETYGPIAVNQWHPEWTDLPDAEQAALKARQGVGNVVAERLRVVSPTNDADVAEDGEETGEILARGNDVMLGYYRDEEATRAATWTDPVDDSAWFRTGDLAVVHPDGYVEIRDRSKDVIISGGENISSVEVERVLDSHPDVVESAVVAVADDRWGELPLAHVSLREGAEVSDEALSDHVRQQLASFKVPRWFVRGELPRTSTGKIQKNVLREQARSDPPPRL
ncbi:AMP-binding protein [Nocardioides sp. GXQ0305]|uniref:AMP-binding protein n=1 Tax=Nocardioides sp. GXQ0305 TaxID=3423912 RepID=UPI003D7E62FD